jgi:hypothetical protein
MPPPPARIMSAVYIRRSRQLIRDSRQRIASAKERITHARQILARQSYVRIVCAWCGQTIRFARTPLSTRGQITHSICYDCFAPIFGELHPESAILPFPSEGA